MKKVLVFIMVVALSLLISLPVLAASEKSNQGNGKQTEKSTQTEKTNLQKQFKQELTTEKKALSTQKSELEAQIETLEAQYQELLAQGKTTEAEAVLASINEINAQLVTLQNEMRQIINERYMVIKTLYSEEELQQFGSAEALIEAMYAEAYTLGSTVTVKNNLIKFEAPTFIKGGKVMIPIKAITQGLGAEVIYDEATQTITITKDAIVVVITANSTTVTINGVASEMTAPAEITCGRTYVPLQFLAETFGLEVEETVAL